MNINLSIKEAEIVNVALGTLLDLKILSPEHEELVNRLAGHIYNELVNAYN